MKAIVVEAPNRYGLAHLPEPRLRDGEALVRVEYCGICASDFEILYGLNHEEVVYPIVPGHEWSGRVEKGSAEFEQLIGKRVIGYNAVTCGACAPCRGGSTLCENRKEIGFSLNGAYAECVAVPAHNLIELPESVDSRKAILAEPLSVCLHAQRLARMKEGQAVAILGDGPIGLLSAILARRLGAGRLLIAGHHSERLRRVAKWTGAAWVNTSDAPLEDAVREALGSKADLVLETTGNPAAASRVIGLLGYGATLCLLGTYRGRSDFNPNDLVLFEQRMIGSLSYTHSEMKEAVAMLGGGLLDGIELVTHTLPVENYAKAFDLVEKRRDGVIKACFALRNQG